MKLSDEDKQKAIEQWAKGSVGFFEANGSTQALAVFTTNKTGSDGTSYLDPTKNAGENDARDLDRMKMSIEAIAEINKKRQSDGGIDGRKLSIVGINDYCMAIAQANANFSNNKFDHAQVYQPPYENLYWGPATTANGNMSPLSGWWDEEKVIFDYLKTEVGLKSRNEMINYIASHQQELQKKFPNFISIAVGHYTNIVDDLMWTSGKVGRDSKVAGYAIRPGMYGYVHSLQLSPSEVGTTYTYEDYKARFMNYYNDLKLRTEGINPNGKADYDKAVASLDEAVTKQKAAETALNNAKAEENNKRTAVTEAEKVKADKASEASAAKSAYDKAQNDVTSANENLESAKADVQKAKDALEAYKNQNANLAGKIDSANQEVEAAKTALEQATKAREDAQGAVNEKTQKKNEAEQNLVKAKAALDAVNADITKAIKAVEDATKALNKAETELEQATEARDDANTKASNAEQEKKKASDEYQNTVDDLNAKKEAAEKAKTDRDNAQNKLNEDTKKFEDLTKALNDYNAKLEEEKAAKTNLDNADKAVKDKEEALAAANEAKTNAEAELSKSKTANEEAKKAFEEATKALEDKKNEYLNAVKKLNLAKTDAMMLLRLIYGDKSSVTSGVKEALKLSCNGSLKYFTGITIDGNFIPVNEYKKDSGSTVVTIPSAYWNKLSSGKHTFQFEYEYGSSPIGTVTIAANEEAKEQIANSNRPMTGDTDSYVLLSGGLFLVSTLLLYRSLKRKEEE